MNSKVAFILGTIIGAGIGVIGTYSYFKDKYEEFIKEGSLIVMEGTVLDMMDVYEDLDNYIIESGYDVRCFGYDPFDSTKVDATKLQKLEGILYGTDSSGSTEPRLPMPDEIISMMTTEG